MLNLFSFQKRSVEDLKERYYHICAKLANIRAAPGTDLKIPVFDAGHERRRKEQLERLYNRTPEQVMPGNAKDRPIYTRSVVILVIHDCTELREPIEQNVMAAAPLPLWVKSVLKFERQ